MDIKIFRCGLCKKDKKYGRTRDGLRKHLREEHRIMSEITNREDIKKGKVKQNWWKEEKN